VPRHGEAAEGVTDGEVVRRGRLLGDVGAGVTGADAQVRARLEAELLPAELDDLGIELEDGVRGARPGGQQVPGKVNPPPPRCSTSSGPSSTTASVTAAKSWM
jgi:hypothetical protein